MPRLPRLHLKSPIRRASAHKSDELAMSRGQIIVLFAASLMVFIGIMGIAIDVSYAWVNEMRIQKAADAAALAGAVYLPDEPGTATTQGKGSATQNGYTDGVSGVTVSAAQNASNHEQMDVSITAPVPTFFMRAFGINSLTATRVAHAQFHLPVPMGSPLNVFGDPTALDLQGQPLNFWAAINGPCTDKQQGDPYATKYYTSNYTSSSSPANCSTYTTPSNSEYKAPSTGDDGAYDYAIKVLTAGTLSIDLYDPEYCSRADQNTDTGETELQANSQFSTVFDLYAPSGTPYDLTDDTLLTTQSYPGGNPSQTGTATDDPAKACSSHYVSLLSGGNWTNGKVKGKWINYATISASVGTYRLNIQTTPVSGKPADASNNFSIRATSSSGTQPQVYAGLAGSQSAMSIYNNVMSGSAYVYLAKINSTFAGKTMEVDLFDPGEVNGDAFMSFLMPNGATWTPVTFNWRDAGITLGSGGTLHTGATSLQTSNGSPLFDGHWVVVTIKVPPTYTATNDGWWKIYYNMSAAAHDRTTWRVRIIDSPVHLVG